MSAEKQVYFLDPRQKLHYICNGLWIVSIHCILLYEPRQANLCLRAFRHDKFQLRMPSHSAGPGIWLSVWRFLLIHCLYERAWTFAARIGDKYQIRLTWSIYVLFIFRAWEYHVSWVVCLEDCWVATVIYRSVRNEERLWRRQMLSF